MKIVGKKVIGVVVIGFFLIAFTSCDKKNDTLKPMGKIEIKMTDAPIDLEAVNIDLKSILLHYAQEADSMDGWLAIETNEGVYNLLELQNGNDTLIAYEEIPAGKITQLRFVLGENNTVVTNTFDTVKLKVPSGMESGIKININKELYEDAGLELLLDFDAELSVTMNGAGEYILNPVIKLLN
jgi:hypothetical protein